MPAAGRKGSSGRARDSTFVEFVLDQLRGLRGVESRAMFGGHGLYQDAVFFAIVHRGRLYFRTDDATRADYQAHGMEPFRPGPGPTLRTYWEVPAEVLEDAAGAVRWARKAVAVGRGAKPKSRARR